MKINLKSSTLDTHNKKVGISQTAFSNPFSRMKSFVFWFEFHWSLFLRVQLTISQHWFRKWLGADQATSHYLKQCWPSSPTHIFGTKGRWVNFPSFPNFSSFHSTHYTGSCSPQRNKSLFITDTVAAGDLGPLLLTWFNFNPSMDK